MPLSNDAYGRTISMTTDGTTDSYLAGSSVIYEFPAGTSQSVVYLSIAIQFNISLFKSAMRDFTGNAYDSFTQQQLTNLYLAAQAAGLTNRQAYLAQILTWVNAITAYAASYAASVNSQTNPAVVATMVFDQTQFAANPNITAVAAMNIPN